MATPRLKMESDDPVKSDYPGGNNTTSSIEPIMDAIVPPVACIGPIKSGTNKHNYTISVKTQNQSNRIGIAKCNFGMDHESMKSIMLMFKQKIVRSHDEIQKTIQRCKTTELDCSRLEIKLMEEQNQVRQLQSKIDILEEKLKRKVEEISLLQTFHVKQANGQVFQVKLHPVRRVPKRLKISTKHGEPSALKKEPHQMVLPTTIKH